MDETQARLYIIPALGDVPLRALDAATIRGFYRKLQRAGVGDPTVEVVHRLLSRVLNQALDDNKIDYNPASRVQAPHAERKPPRVLTVAEVVQIAVTIDRGRAMKNEPDTLKQELRYILEGCASDAERLSYFSSVGHQPEGWGTMTILAYFTGLRFGEVSALKRRAVKVAEWEERPRVEVIEAAVEVRGHISIGGTKTKGSRRSVPIPKPVAEIMRRHLDAWEPASPWAREQELKERKHEPVFGGGSRSNFRSRVWVPAVKSTGIDPAPNFHDLRHSYAPG